MAADSDGRVREETATSSLTDLRRARQRARAAVRELLQAIQDYLSTTTMRSLVEDAAGERRVNAALTELAAKHFREGLVEWLEERHRITAGRAVREAFDKMAGELPEGEDRSDLTGLPRVSGADREWLRQLHRLDVGLLSGTETAREAGATSDSLASDLGDRLTRQLRLGVRNGESQAELARRVELVMDDAKADDRSEKGISGQTTRSKAELIAHDSVQDAYNTAARDRYLRNGFRYGTFDAVLDTKTTELCRRMDEHVIDFVETPFFVPPLHPYCRSGIRPVLDVTDKEALVREDVADGFLNTILQTKSYRPPTDTAGRFQPTPLSERYGHTDG